MTVQNYKPTRQTYKTLLNLKEGEQTVLLFNNHDKAMYQRGYPWAWHRARMLVARAMHKSNARFTTKGGPIGLLVTRLADVPELSTHDVKNDIRAITKDFGNTLDWLKEELKKREPDGGRFTNFFAVMEENIGCIKKKYDL